jgi:outer membrane phospholipase A
LLCFPFISFLRSIAESSGFQDQGREHGAESIEQRAWGMEHGAESMGHGAWGIEQRAWFLIMEKSDGRVFSHFFIP